MGWKVRSMFNRIWWPDFCHQWILLYFYISNFINHHGSSLLVSFIQDTHGPWPMSIMDRKDFMFLLFRMGPSGSRRGSVRYRQSIIESSIILYYSFKWLIIFSALGTFALLAETSFLCVCLMDKEWYRNFLDRVNFGHFRKAIFYTV